MPGLDKENIRCNCCGESFAAAVCHCADVVSDPSLKEKVRDGSLFVHECPHCGRPVLQGPPFLYLDPSSSLAIIVSDATLDDSALDPSYTARQVSTIGELVEKVKIFDDGLDDVAMELCKHISVQELGVDVALKYLNMSGPDGEITFAYPSDSHMEMVAVGFNVYEDCRGIVSRNKVFAERTAGLCRVDAEFIDSIIR